MRKLKIALTLLFAMSLSLFLFACGGDPADNSKEGIKTVVVEVGKDAKVAYTDADTANSWTNAGITVKVNYTDASRESAVIPSDECDWDISAVKWGEVNTTLGYEIKVTPKDQPGTPVTGTYRVTVGHNWGTASQDGTSECGHCHAQMTERDITDVIRYKGFHAGPYTGEADKYSDATTELGTGGGTMMDGVLTVSYGTIGIGQTFTLTGHAEAFRAEYMETVAGAEEKNSHWFFPIMGVSIGNNSLLVRNDGWVLYDGIGGGNVNASDRKLQGFFETGADGTNGKFDNEVIGDVVEENYNNGVVMPSDAADWFPYMEGDLCRTADYEDGGADIELTWEFRLDNVMVITFNNIDAGKLMTMSFKVPTQSYNIILHGERVVMELDHLSSISTLTNPVYRVDEVTKTDYAEGEMFDISSVKAFANYTQANNVPVAAAVYATLNEQKVDLTVTPLTPAMTDIRVEFGTQVIYLTNDRTQAGTALINVAPSVFTGADGKTAIEHNGAAFLGEKAQYAYGAADGKVVFTVTGTANSLSAEQKTALGTDKDFYIAVNLVSRLTGEDFNDVFETFNPTTDLTVKLGNDALTDLAVSGEGTFGAIIPVDASMLEKNITFHFEGITAQADIVLDLSNLEIPAAASVISGKATIAGGGDVTVVYKADAFKEDLSSNIRIYEGNNQLQGTAIANGAKLGALTVKSVAQDKTAGTLTLVYTLPAVNLTNINLSYNIRLRIGSDYVNDTVYYTAQVGAESANENAAVVATDNIGALYAQVDGSKLYILKPYEVAGQLHNDQEIRVNANLGAASITTEDYAKARLYTLTYSLLISGEVSFNNASDTLAAASTVQHFVIGDDGVNRGAYVLITADLAALGIRATEDTATQAFGFEINPADVTVGAAHTIYMVSDKVQPVSVTPDAETVISSGDCAGGSAQRITAYAYQPTGAEAVVFYYGIEISGAQHTWTGEADGVQTCSVCGAVKKDDNAKNVTVAALGEDVKTKGFSISFLASDSGNVDWDTKFIESADFQVSLMNFGAWDTLDKSNIYSGFNQSVLQNGASYAAYLLLTSYATVVFDPDATNGGVRYYQNGVLVANYTNDIVLQYNNSNAVNPDEAQQKKVSDFVTALLNRLATNAFTFASQPGAEDMYLQKTVLNAADVQLQYELYLKEHGPITIVKGTPVYPARQGASAESPIIAVTTAATDAAPSWTTELEKGHKIVLSGETSSGRTELWHGPFAYAFSGDVPRGWFRTDNYTGEARRLMVYEGWTITNQATGSMEAIRNANVVFTYDWTNENKIVITMAYTDKTNSELVYNQEYVIVPDINSGREAFDETSYSVGFGGAGCQTKITSFTIDGVTQQPKADDPIYTVGRADNGTTYSGKTPLWQDYDHKTISAGEKIVISGRMTSTGANQWNGPTTLIWSGSSNAATGVMRPDAYIVDGDAMKTAENVDIAQAFVNGGSWGNLSNMMKDCAIEITFDYSDASKVVVKSEFTKDSTTYSMTYTMTATDGNTLAQAYNFGLGVDACYIVITGVAFTPAAD